MLITENIIGQRPFHDGYTGVTWATSAILPISERELLEDFTARQRACIVSVVNENPDNPWYGTSGGEDTKDTVFLLSPEEVLCKYFGMSVHPKKNQRYRFERKDPNNPKRVAYLSWKKEQVWWWIRIKEE